MLGLVIEQETHSKYKNTQRLKVMQWRKKNQKKAGVDMVIWYKADFRTKKIIRDKQRVFVMIIIKGLVLWDYIIILNMCALKSRVSK